MQRTETAAAVDRVALARAILYGALAGAAGGLVWFGVVFVTNRHLSAMSMGIGVLVAQAVLIASGKRGGVAFQATAVLLTLAALLVTEAFAIRMLAVRELVELGSDVALPVFLPINVMKDLVSAGITADPPTSLFWGIGLWYAVSMPRRRVAEEMLESGL